MSAPPAAAVTTASTGTLPEHAHVVVVGAGFAGLGATIRLQQAGFDDVVVLERADEVGGTWRDNTYPGAACDVQSQLYSLSFAAGHDWSRTYAAQPDIQAYLETLATTYAVRPKVVFGCELERATWDETAARWSLQTSRGAITADRLLLASGALSDAALPAVPGIETFAGTVFHSARWDHEHDLTGERVVVVGSGASAIQLVPQIAPRVAHLTMLMRTPPWVMPRGDGPIPGWRRRLYTRSALYRRLTRAGIYLTREVLVVPLALRPALVRYLERAARAFLAASVPEPELRAALSPAYRMGCKRILISDDFYPAVRRPNVSVVPAELVEVRAHSVVDAAGREHQADTIVFATGFAVRDLPIAHRVHGRSGETLAEHWAGSPHAYLGTTVPGFPNLFTLFGPNTGTGHTSQVFMIEAQIAQTIAALSAMRAGGLRTLEVKERVERRFTADVRRRMRHTVWTTGGCGSWYLDRTGRNSTLWPGSSIRFRRLARRFRLRDFLRA